MKVTYEFIEKDGDDDGRKVFEKAVDMYMALCDIEEHLRSWRKGWEEDREKTLEAIQECLMESGYHDIR